jgi:GAF domain-containing protein
VRNDGAIIWGRLTASLVRDPSGTPAYAIGMVEDITDWVRLRGRREALLRLPHHLAVETGPERVMQTLLEGAVELTGGNFGLVARWDDARQVLHPVWNTLPLPGAPVEVRLGEGAGGQAAARRASVTINDYRDAPAAVPQAVDAGLHAAMAAPLLHEARLLGVVTVASSAPGKQFAPEDASLLELMAGLASAVLVGMERSRLEGALLAARTAQHELSNQLGAVLGYAELLSEDPRLSDELRTLAQEIRVAAAESASTVQQLGRVTRLEEVHQGGPGTVLDLPRSTDSIRSPQ